MERMNLQVGEAVRRRLEAAVARLSHAYIVEGPVRETTHALAHRLAQAYVCSGQVDRPCGVCVNCRKAEGNIHPDIVRVSLLEDKRMILVDQIRQLRTDAYIRPNEADRKVFIIEDAHTMNSNAQNALLKVLEEGPHYLGFLLLTENSRQLLPTIRSRCEVLSLSACNEANIPEADEELKQTAEQLAGYLLAGDELALVELTARMEAAKKTGKETLSVFFDLVENSLRDRLTEQPEKVIPMIEHLRRLRQALPFNVGAGHLLGWLAAGN